MEIIIVSHKETWISSASPSGFATVGGFPIQIQALSELFEKTVASVTLRDGPAPPHTTPIGGNSVTVMPLPEPEGRGLARKILLFPWLLSNGTPVWRRIGDADAVHALVPGDVGFLGLLLAVVRRKPLFIRHCGTWGDRSTLANRFLAWVLPKIAGGTVVVMATGGGPAPPEPKNSEIQWIFATSLTETEYENIQTAAPWVPGGPLRLATVGRLTTGKNALACVEAMPAIREAIPGSNLAVVGDGPFRDELEKVVAHLGLDGEVVFHGNLNHKEVLEVLCESHVFLFPTRVAEGFPKAVLEAMACGLPVIASSVSVLPHLLDDGCGVVLEGTGADDVETAVVDLVGDPGLMAAIGRKARERAGSYTLERWRDLIGERLEAAWGCRLKSGGGDDSNRTGAAD